MACAMPNSGTLIGLVTSTDLLGLLVDRAQAQVLPFDFKLRAADSNSYEQEPIGMDSTGH
jgi:hypothetical protein